MCKNELKRSDYPYKTVVEYEEETCTYYTKNPIGEETIREIMKMKSLKSITVTKLKNKANEKDQDNNPI